MQNNSKPAMDTVYSVAAQGEAVANEFVVHTKVIVSFVIILLQIFQKSAS